EAIVTRDYLRARRFVAEVDAACVLVNASTRLVDGSQFGMGAELGISTSKLHARGPVGVEELTTTKFVVTGSGQIREELWRDPAAEVPPMAEWRFGILGGTFNPIHLGHLVLAEAFRERLGLDRVLFVPAGTPPHKPSDGLVSALHRYAMVSLAVAGHPG